MCGGFSWRGGLVKGWMRLLLNDHDSLQGVSWPFVCKLVHYFLGFVMWGGYNYGLAM
jgi:hypothetical protein